MGNNQLFIGTNTGDIRVLYDPETSTDNVGILRCVQKRLKRKAAYDIGAFANFDHGEIIVNPVEIADKKWKEFEDKNPELAKMQRFQDRQSEMFLKPEIYEQELENRRLRKQYLKKLEEESKPQQKTNEKHTGAFGKGGRLTNSGTYAQYIMKNTIKNTMRDEDPREALLARAKDAEANPLFINSAYQATQPKTIFNTKEPIQDNQKLIESKGVKRSCPHCGKKFCSCGLS